MATSRLVWSIAAIVIHFSVLTESVVLAKAQLKECANRGTGEEQCTSRGVIVTVAIHNEQNRTERLYAKVYAVKDPATGQILQMAKPFQVILSKSEVTIHYPVFNLRKMVNNKPWEKQIKTGSCDDEWKRDKVTCGYQKFKNGQRIMYSQGYCCYCSWYGFAGRTSRLGHYSRNPNVVCNFWTRQKSAFCMRFDKLWYGVYEVLTPSLVFDITVEVLKKGRNMWHGDTEHATWNKVSTFKISPSVPAMTSPDGKVRAKWVGDLDIPEKLHDLSQKFLLIPSDRTFGEEDHTDTINNVTYHSGSHFQNIQNAGSKEWLFVDKAMFDFTGSKCNKIGVYYEAFKFQENRCYDKKGSCFRHQPYHLWAEDKRRVDKDLPSRYFPASFGPFLWERVTNTMPLLQYYLDRTHNSIVNLWLDADDVIFIYNWAPGKIVETYVGDFEALTNDGELNVMVKNTGNVQSDYILSVGSCTRAIGTIPAQTFSIEAGQSDMRKFKLFAYDYKGTSSSCKVYLRSTSTGELLDSKLVQFVTTSTCFDFGVCGNVCDVNSTLSCKQPPPVKDDGGFDLMSLVKRFQVYIYILVGFFITVLALKIYGIVKRRRRARKKIELNETVDEEGNVMSVENKKQKRKMRRVLLGILAVMFLPLLPIMWYIRRWSTLQKARLLKEQEKLRSARAQTYKELQLLEDFELAEDNNQSAEEEKTTNSIDEDKRTSSEEEENTTSGAEEEEESTTSVYESSSDESTGCC